MNSVNESSRVWRREADVPTELAPGVVTIGNFDGVHRGHQRVLESVVQYGREHDLVPRALTFTPHPRHVMTRTHEPALITSYADRSRLVAHCGIVDVLDLDFTLSFAQLSARDFVRGYIVELLGAKAVVIGRDSRFGRKNHGDYSTMVELGREFGFEVLCVDELGDTATGTPRISSSAIREAIVGGDVAGAAGMLGRWHSVCDVVRHGFKRGRELGFPTANFSVDPEGLVPADGVYAGYFSVLDGDRFLERVPATISVGTNPTFEDGPEHRLMETYVHGSHDYHLYDRKVRVEFVERLRDTLAFSGVDALIEQMHEDVAVTRSTLEKNPSPCEGRD